MKKISSYFLIMIIVAILFSNCNTTAQVTADPESGTITYQNFYDGLSPYGTWIDYPTYGHVWHPRVDGDFRPYATNGNWAYSTDGWAWQSDYEWGWAPFHYGNWLYDDSYGWLWVPGYTWSPAWVTWGSVDDYYCWAPLAPGLGFGFQLSSWHPHDVYWNVCDRSHIYDHNLSASIIGRDRIGAISSRINIINNFHTDNNHADYSRGPSVGDVERYTHQTISPVRFNDVHDSRQAGRNGDHMNVYRPTVSHPQPQEFKRPLAEQTNPIRDNNQRLSNEPERQRSNIESLPSFRSQGFGGRSNFSSPGGGRRR